MGSMLSKLWVLWKTIEGINSRYKELLSKISLSPGLPVPNPTISYWTDPPALISRHGIDKPLPSSADIVIIGSGITGTVIARTILDHYRDCGRLDSLPSIVMLEARETCFGATGRNGGHISPVLYADYPALKEKFGTAMANKIMKFRLAHRVNLLAAAEEEDLFVESQCRDVQTFDVYFDAQLYEESKAMLLEYSSALPSESQDFRVIEDAEEIAKLKLSEKTLGCIATKAGALHPYRLVTGILTRLLMEYQSSFHLFTGTPCTSVELTEDTSKYQVHTSKGIIQALHVVHATNAWSSHLLPLMRGKIIPIRAEMTAQRPGRGLSTGLTPGAHSFVFYPERARERFEYLVQQPVAQGLSQRSDTPSGEFMFGGGLFQGGPLEAPFFDALGNADDSTFNFNVVSLLAGVSGLYFGKHWGRESRPNNDDDSTDSSWMQGRLKGYWTGIIGFSADEMPWAGRIPPSVTGRSSPQPHTSSTHNLSSPGEWISAGFTGEGMTQAWLTGKATAAMILGPALESEHMTEHKGQRVSGLNGVHDWRDWFPEPYVITEMRWKDASFEKM